MKTYPAICHVCDKEHTIHAEFLSAPASRNGKALLSCGSHTAAEVRAAFEAASSKLQVHPRGPSTSAE